MNRAVANSSSKDEQLDLNLAAATETEGRTAGTGGDELTGRQLDSYMLEARLGGGAMAIVYRARDLTTNRPVALKLLNPSADAVLRERFRVEARTVRALDHPHIVRTLGAGQSEDGLTYIAMELVEGDSLSTLLEQRHKISVLDSCRLLAPIARALAHAHEKGIVHRDVKPSNILLRRVPVGTINSVPLSEADYAVIPLLSDFGIARALDAPELTTAGRTIGTPAYMSPEQCAGTRELDGRADIYSMGAVFYRCLVGRPPFVGATTQILHAHVYEPLTIPQAVAQALPGTILDVLRRALQKEPADRYHEVALLAGDLELLIRQATGNTKSAADSTLTMPILFAATPGPEQVASQVLVAGVGNAPARPLIPWVPPAPAATKSTNLHSVTANRRDWRARSRRSNWVVIGAGILISAVLIGLGALAITTILPFTNRNQVISGDPPTLVADSSTLILSSQTPTPAMPTSVSSAPIAALITAATSATVTTGVTTTPGVTTAQAVTTANPVTTSPILSSGVTTAVTSSQPTSVTQLISATNTALDVVTTWTDIEQYHRIGDWGRARFFLLDILVLEGKITSLSRTPLPPAVQAQLAYVGMVGLPDDRFWSTWADVFTREEMQRILADSYIGTAASQIATNRLISVTNYLDAAATIQPDDPLVAALSAATKDYLQASSLLKTAAGNSVAQVYGDYARARASAGAYCIAFDALIAIPGLTAGANTNPDVASYERECTRIQNISSGASPSEPMTGQIYYSTVDEGDYRIYRATVPTGTATLVVDGGTQPSLAGSTLAFYSRRPGADGLSGINLTGSQAPADPFQRYTGAIEDSADSPPRWNVQTGQLVFSSKDNGDRRSRIFVTSGTFGDTTKWELNQGEDPAWSPDGATIVYRYTGVTGNDPGLWLMDSSGANPRRLTSGEDRRPIWSADGRYIIFMRQMGDKDWDIVRLELESNALLSLSAPDAQDGLPALSPGGTLVAFASDREGTWKIYTVPLDGGDATLLMPIKGVLQSWLEHAIQWVN